MLACWNVYYYQGLVVMELKMKLQCYVLKREMYWSTIG